jgi:predicted SprT family Zn-dependent metalloprotease
MEREFDGGSIFTRTDRTCLEDIVTHACRKYRVPRPRLVIGRDKDRFMGYADDKKIYLNADFHGQNTQTLLHELAHWIVDHLFEKYETHGPEFTCVYMHLLNAYRVLPKFAFRKLCKDFGLKIARLKDPFLKSDDS